MHPASAPAAAPSNVVKRYAGNSAPAAVSLEIPRVPACVYLTARLVMAMVSMAVVSILLMLTVPLVGKVMLELVRWTSMLILALLGVIPCAALATMVTPW